MTATQSNDVLPPPLKRTGRTPYDPAQLHSSEIFWRDHQKWLETNGYMLRPRYRPDWVPSWKGKDEQFYNYEDGNSSLTGDLLDATRISDGELVMLKKISGAVHPYEVQITQHFSTEPLVSHPRNHCVPLYDVLQIPDEENISIIIIPLLSKYNSPPFETVGEVVEYFRQVFEGLQFMHQCHVAHRDCMNLNIMMDPKPMFPDMFHPIAPWKTRDFKGSAKYHSRTARPPTYFLIDFGLSRKYNPDDGPPREDIILGGDKTVPEFQTSDDPCDPFPTDVYYLGNMIRGDFLQKTRGVEFMEQLVSDMVQDDPSKRPTMDEVVERYAKLLGSLSWLTLRSRLVYNDQSGQFVRSVLHLFRVAGDVIMHRSAIPTP